MNQRYLDVTLIGNKKNSHINPVNCNASADYRMAANYEIVNMDGVKNLVIINNKNQFKIIQAGCFTPNRGLFVDLY